MRPDRAIVKKAIQDAERNLSKTAGLLGCTRQTLYTWIYQLGLEREAGIRMDRQTQLDRARRVDTRREKDGKEIKSGVYSEPEKASNLRLVEQALQPEVETNVSFRCRESLWREMKVKAIRRGLTVAKLAEIAFERTLAEEEAKEKKGRK